MKNPELSDRLCASYVLLTVGDSLGLKLYRKWRWIWLVLSYLIWLRVLHFNLLCFTLKKTFSKHFRETNWSVYQTHKSEFPTNRHNRQERSQRERMWLAVMETFAVMATVKQIQVSRDQWDPMWWGQLMSRFGRGRYKVIEALSEVALLYVELRSFWL